MQGSAKRSPGGQRKLPLKQSPHAGPQFLGYSLQATRAVVRLLRAKPDSFVSVEVFEDVGVEDARGARTAEQTKSALRHNPVSNRAIDLWKTFANWTEAVKHGHIDPDRTTFELYVTPKRTGPIAESFHNAKTLDAGLLALTAARNELWGPSPKHPKRPRVGASLAPHLERVFTSNDEMVASIIAQFSLQFGLGDSVKEVEAALAAELISEEMVPAAARQVIGWAKAEIDGMLERSAPAVVARSALKRHLLSFVEKYDRQKILYSFASPPTPEAIDAELPTRRYIRQLELIDVDFESKLRAANDFLRASTDRSQWAEKGLVHPTSFDEFEDALLRAWMAKRMALSVTAKGSPSIDVGRLLFAECSQLQQELERRPVPPHFTPGCYHALAEVPRLGWHPDYEAALARRAE